MTPDRNPVLPRKLVVLLSGTGSLLQALLDAAPAAPWQVVGVISDRPGVAGLERARAAGVPTTTVPPADFPDRSAWDEGMAAAIDAFGPDLVISAGFMRLLGAPVLSRWGGRIINTHPALLPAFPGAHGVRDALAYGVKVTGASVIVVDEGVDAGPVVAQRAVPVLDDDDEERLHERIKVVERELLVEVVDRMATAGWTVTGRHVRLG